MRHLCDIHPDDHQARIDLINDLTTTRREQKISQHELARRIHRSHDWVSLLETPPVRPGRQRHNPSVNTLQVYARGVGQQLMFGFASIKVPAVDAVRLLNELADRAATYEDADNYQRQALLEQMIANRHAAGYTLLQVANIMGCSESAVQQVEAGGADSPRLSTYQRHQRAIGGALTITLHPIDTSTHLKGAVA